jgi:catechol 2,3-dioxygenase-like lactoylglutathione lyase family enzyme
MLSGKNAMATIAVKDIAAAKKFYGGTLGFKTLGSEGEEAVITWGVGDELEAIVQTLKSAGVPFEHYDLPDLRREGDIHFVRGFKGAWFRDPDGNILHINSR